jgi:uncharacterized membrane protein (Fun14 family)
VLLSILRHLANRNMNAVVLMALIGLVMSYFSKNMIIVLLTAVISVFILEMLDSQGVMEGMETKEGSDKDKEKDKNSDDADGEDASDNIKEKNTTMTDNKGNDNDKGKGKDNDNDNDKGKEEVKTEKVREKKEKQGMAILTPAKYNDDAADDDVAVKNKKNSGNRIDYAATLEEAYDNIETIIGEEGVRGLTDQTKSLMNMKDMGPLLKSAEGFMKQITGNGGIGGITEMLKGFATPAAKK